MQEISKSSALQVAVYRVATTALCRHDTPDLKLASQGTTTHLLKHSVVTARTRPQEHNSEVQSKRALPLQC